MHARQSGMGTTAWGTAGRSLIAASSALTLAFSSTYPAAAQDGSADARVRRLEAEMRALQRKVFPGGAQTFQPEITPPASTTAPVAGATTSAVTDLLTRMDAIEAQMARITAQNEQNTNRLAQIEARLGPVGAPPPPVTSSDSAAAATMPPTGAVAPPVTPSASRVEAVRAIQKPQSADAGDDEYSYGYRLWDAKFFPEAEQQLRLYLQQYPKHPRVSYARNLLGRAFLDDDNPREAAKWFLQNYQADKAGARAPDSLLYLARSMKQLGDAKRACIAAGEFASSYAAEAAGRLKSDYDDTRKGLACG